MNEATLALALPQLLLLRDAAELRRQTLLYHYTSAAGLHGIVSSATLWASNYLYLNDTSEIEYGRNLVLGFLRDEAQRCDADHERELLRGASDRLDLNTSENERDPIIRQNAPLDVYITSFCEEPSLLSQWRAYGGAEGRYCIGFETKEFDGFGIVFPARVVYERAEQIRLLSEITNAVFGAMRYALKEKQIPPELARVLPSLPPKTSMSDSEILSDARFAVQYCLDRILCRLKHPAFAEEREWRSMVDLSNYEQTEVLKFQATGGVVRPYVERLRGSRSDPTRLPIREIYVGHSRRPAQAKRTVELLLRQFGYRNCEVKIADVPLVE